MLQKKNNKKKITSPFDIEIRKPKLNSNEPLFYELDNFLTSIINGEKPNVTGEQGKDAVELALNILKNITF